MTTRSLPARGSFKCEFIFVILPLLPCVWVGVVACLHGGLASRQAAGRRAGRQAGRQAYHVWPCGVVVSVWWRTRLCAAWAAQTSLMAAEESIRQS
jgi:hypothetical protein